MNIKELTEKTALAAPPSQEQLFRVEKQIERDGVEMGVLENGVPYLSETGLARMCGVARRSIRDLAADWNNEKTKPRGQRIQEKLIELGYTEPNLFVKATDSGVAVNAYTEPVCLAILEYYAFDASPQKKEAQNAFRTLAKVTFSSYIYAAVGYSPETEILERWKHYYDRVDMTKSAVPDGYFCVFSEIAPMLIPLITAGLIVNDKVIPDISVGQTWAKYWKDNDLDQNFGERIKYAHNYPPYYPQAKSNPQPAHAYPELALGVFRQWLRTNYLETKFPKYLLEKAKRNQIPRDNAVLVLDALQAKKTLPNS